MHRSLLGRHLLHVHGRGNNMQVGMGIDHAGGQRSTGAINDFSTFRESNRGSHILDQVSLNQHVGIHVQGIADSVIDVDVGDQGQLGLLFVLG